MPASGTSRPYGTNPDQQHQQPGHNLPVRYDQRRRPSEGANPMNDFEMGSRSPQERIATSQAEVPEYIRTIQGLSTQERSLGCGSHFLTMMAKNLRMKWRTPISSLLETLLPVIFIVGLICIWLAVNDVANEEKNFVTSAAPTTVKDFNSSLIDSLCVTSNATDPPLGVRACSAAELSSPTLYCFPTEKTRAPAGLCMIVNPTMIVQWTDFEQPRFVPTLDELIILQWFVGSTMSKPKFAAEATITLALQNSNGPLHFAPDTPEVRALAAHMNESSILFRYVHGQIFPSGSAGADWCSTKEQSDKNWGVLEVTQLDRNGAQMTVRMNRTGMPDTTQITQVGNGIDQFGSKLYMAAGFLTLQDVVSRYHSERVLNLTAMPRAVHTPMGYQAYDTSSFLTIIGSIAALFLVFGYLYPVSQLVKRIVEEKEQRVREAMMIMGLSTAPFYASWIVTYFIFQFFTALLAAILLKVTMFPKSDFFIIFFLYFLFGLSNIGLAGVLSSFFSKARISAIVSPVVFFICAVPSFALPDTTSPGALVIISLLSPTAFANGMNVLVDLEINGGATRQRLGESFNGYPLGLVYFMFILDTVIYVLLTLYFDAVLPSEWGTRKSPCFCFTAPCRWLFGSRDESGEDRDGRDPDGVYEPITPGIKPSVELRGMRKEFKLPNGETMVAVNDLTFNMYEDQVFALLGHNGAGKTTAMNLMTGMLEMDNGDCRFHGHSVRYELDKVRQEIGYCPQHNILWNELTCREHLDFFAKLKGMAAEHRPAAVEAMLKAVDLEAKGDKYPHELSGGQKRKLSVGIAFVGGSKVVFLDEPTAGMDVAARRHTWELIKLMTPGRTIVLTTHFMDEADLLGNTIAIMAKGRLKCAGSSLFLKNRLGVGYTLTIACAHGVDSNDRLIDSLRHYVPNLDVLANGGGEVGVRLPMDAVPQFPALLAFLEDNARELGIRGHGISVTTLEEIFLKTGHDDEAATHPKNTPMVPPAGNAAWGQPVGVNGSVTRPEQVFVAVEEEKNKLVFTEEVANAHGTPVGQLIALLKKRFHYARRDTRTIVMQMVLPVLCITVAMLLALIKPPNAKGIDVTDYGEYTGSSDFVIGANCPQGWANSAGVRVVNASSATNLYNLSTFLIQTEKQHEKNRMGSHICRQDNVVPFLENVSSSPIDIYGFFTNNSIYPHSAPMAMWQYQQAYARYATGTSVSMRVTNHPLPMSPYEQALINGFTSVFVAIFILIPFTFVPSTFVSFVVKEREVRALQLQQASGLKYVVYWTSNFIFDILSFVVTALLAITIFGIFGRDEYIGDASKFFAVFVLLMLYGLAGVAGSYVSSFAFDSHSTAQNIVMLVNFICGFMLVLLAYILTIIDSTKSAGEVLRYFFRIIPSYCLGEGILNMATNDLRASFGAKESVWAMSVVGWPMLYMALELPIFMALVFFLDSPTRREQQQKLMTADGPDIPIENEDEDVRVERQEIESGMRDGTDHVVVKGLRKYYSGNGGVLAVKNLSFGVHRGEVFGFLGTNGAGKTTTISILCGEQLPTRGEGWIAGHNIVSDAAKARSVIGYCPQFDALHDLLTVEEHMELYAGLHGLHGALKTEVVERLIGVCGLEEHRVKESRSLSGGNKRKLSVAISLLGAPQVVFLDEPSAGMDPMARRQMWGVIEQVAAHCSVVLTTHHLEEIEALSSRMGIMVDGELKCIGPLQHLKTKFGSGFEMSLRVKSENLVPNAEQFVAANMAGAVIQERRGPKLTVALPQSTRLSVVFQQLERNKQPLGITDYSVSQTTLESVFLRISAEAKNVSDE